ncbi:anaerobic ribonucleoside-triphosphate reductase activating protein [Persephonella sp.]|uniref:anaerobic ribonucleoside-triphosphate reductase activating protein n=1 Tax=Persephonella sp. TaxID=2060922 RepID=UPI00262725EA|nr:anaerobic ribonucleoside-triphosphate reductase activating protein [Persephonella sp.]
MKIAGIQKFSLIDFPGKLSAVLFVQGCNFRCGYCHNRELVLPEYFSFTIPDEEVFQFLKNRIGKLQGVVITGGEPTIFADLIPFIKKIKSLGFSVKLDTNGSNPEILKEIIENNLVDYIAMDIKAPISKYKEITGVETDTEKILKSVELIKNSKLDYEFRTTLIKSFHSLKEILQICQMIKNSKKYVLQNFNPSDSLVSQEFKEKTGFSQKEIENLKNQLKKFCPNVAIRN